METNIQFKSNPLILDNSSIYLTSVLRVSTTCHSANRPLSGISQSYVALLNTKVYAFWPPPRPAVEVAVVDSKVPFVAIVKTRLYGDQWLQLTSHQRFFTLKVSMKWKIRISTRVTEFWILLVLGSQYSFQRSWKAISFTQFDVLDLVKL